MDLSTRSSHAGCTGSARISAAQSNGYSYFAVKGELVCTCREEHARQPCPPAGRSRGHPSLKNRDEPAQAPAGEGQGPIAKVRSPQGCSEDGAVSGMNPAFSHLLLQRKAPSAFPVRRWHPQPSPKAPSTTVHLFPSLHARSSVTQPATSLPLDVFCWGTCRACLANEKLLWIPLWAFQKGLARFLQSRHGKTSVFL